LGVKVGINGFGRTGRLAYRAALELGLDLDFVAINRGDTKTLAHLLKYDSIHGHYPGKVEAADGAIVVDGHNDLPWRLRVQFASNLDEFDLSVRHEDGHTDIPRLREGGVGRGSRRRRQKDRRRPAVL